MKKIVHVLRQIFMSTRVIENHIKYQILCTVCALIHIFFTVLMLISNIFPMVALNLFAIAFYIFGAIVIAGKEKFKLLFILAFIEVEFSATVSSIFLGSGYDYMVYTLSLIPGAFYLAHTWPNDSKNKYGISMIPLVSTLVVGGLYILVEILNNVVPPAYSGGELLTEKPIIHYFNIICAVLLLLTFSILFALEVRYFQKILNDENSKLDEIASKDPLTKALNRRSFYTIINKEIEAPTKPEFGIIILDIDDFKIVNDTYGHIVGDNVLIAIADIMMNSIRDNDYCCRWGGEEFICMIHGSGDECAVVAERIRSAISDNVIKTDKSDFTVTATLGIAEYQTGIQLRTLIDMADQKLYFGKQHGKNQVVK